MRLHLQLPAISLSSNNTVIEGLDMQGQGQGPSLQGQGLDLQGQGHDSQGPGQGQRLKFGP